MSTPDVDVIIAAHDPRRQIARAVRSIVVDNPEARAVVVCHNVPVEEISATLPSDLAEKATFLHLADGLRSPSGPFMHGIHASTAQHVSIMGSDDCLAPGAVRAWRAMIDEQRADAVIARIERGDERVLVRSPALRPRHHGPLDVVRDRLPYRSAPLGLLRRTSIDRLGLRLTPDAENGGDLEFVSRLWATGRVVYAGQAPAYIEMADAPVRVTTKPKPIAQELAVLPHLVTSAWFAAQPGPVREAFAVKLFRRNVLDTILKRRDQPDWPPEDLAALQQISQQLFANVPTARQLLSAAEHATWTATQEGDVSRLVSAAGRSKHYRSLTALLGRHPRSALHPAGSLRFTIASALMR